MSFEIAVERRLGEARIALDLTSDGGITALFGPSGAGKSSVLNMVAGLLRPDSGRIAVDGETLFDAAAGIDLPPERRRAGYVFQDGRLFPHKRVRDNLLYGWHLADPANRWMSLAEAVAFLGIDHLLARWPRTLSGGEAQRVAIARALAVDPPLLLLDEPTASLDPARRNDLGSVLRTLAASGQTLLVTSHDDDFVRDFATRVVILADGRVVEEGDPRSVLERPAHEETRRLLQVERSRQALPGTMRESGR